MLARQREYEYYEEELQPQRIEKPAPPPKRRPTLNTHLRSRCFLLLALVSIMAMAVTIRSGITASRGYDLVKIQQQAETLEKENEHLKIEIAQMKSPERVRDFDGARDRDSRGCGGSSSRAESCGGA